MLFRALIYSLTVNLAIRDCTSDYLKSPESLTVINYYLSSCQKVIFASLNLPIDQLDLFIVRTLTYMRPFLSLISLSFSKQISCFWKFQNSFMLLIESFVKMFVEK